MNRFLKLLVLVIPFSFLMGTWWGLRSIEKRFLFRNRAGTEIKLLYRRGYLPPQVLTGFEEKTGIQVVGIPMETDQALWEEISERPANYDLIQLFSYMAQDPVGSQIFADLDKSRIPKISKVSVDFIRLAYDPDFRFLLPLNWGLNGFLWNPKVGLPPGDMKSLMIDKKLKGRISLLPQQVEIFSFLEKTGTLLPEWLEQEKWEQLAMATKDLLDQVSISNDLPGEMWKQGKADVIQVANGPASEVIMNQGETPPTYWLPEDKTNLWISLVGISKTTSHLNEAHDFLNYLLEDSTIQHFVAFNSHATAIKPTKAQHIHPMQHPEYLRQIALNRVQLQSDTASLTPIWFRTLSKALPEVFPDPREKRDEAPPPPTETPVDPKAPKSSEKPIIQVVKEALPPSKPVSRAPSPLAIKENKPKPPETKAAPAPPPPPREQKTTAPAEKPRPVARKASPPPEPKPKPVLAKPQPRPVMKKQSAAEDSKSPPTNHPAPAQTSPTPPPTPVTESKAESKPVSPPATKPGLRPVGSTSKVRPVGTTVTAPSPPSVTTPPAPVKKKTTSPPEEATEEEPTTDVIPADADTITEPAGEEGESSTDEDSPFD
ncbi:MAG: hypothetical protein H6624_04220 [Bdellovibrionaceae bacterium]|nr:hypothetical protein [Bdellovibrionales bacterium]MCB9083521.1 hypothetical protein [Pseudobdellovibrionaceae bacterium]